MFVVVVVVMLFVVVKADRSVTCFQTHGARTRLVLLLCLMFELTIKTQTAQNHSGVAARRERRWQDRPLAASPRGYWCFAVFLLLMLARSTVSCRSPGEQVHNAGGGSLLLLWLLLLLHV